MDTYACSYALPSLVPSHTHIEVLVIFSNDLLALIFVWFIHLSCYRIILSQPNFLGAKDYVDIETASEG